MSEVNEVQAFIEAIRPVKVSDDGPYKRVDRYRDFHTVFSTPEGRRVLSQIVDHCDRPVAESDAGNTAKMTWSAAQRDVGLWIAATAATPVRTVTQEQRPPVRSTTRMIPNGA